MSNYQAWDLYSLGGRIIEWRRRAREASTYQQRRSYEGEICAMGREFDRKFFTGPHFPAVAGSSADRKETEHDI